IITRNVMADGAAERYPGGNSFPTAAQFETHFVSYGGGNYQLIGDSPWRGAGADGQDLGALFDGAPSGPPASAQPIEGDGVISGGAGRGRRFPQRVCLVGAL